MFDRRLGAWARSASESVRARLTRSGERNADPLSAVVRLGRRHGVDDEQRAHMKDLGAPFPNRNYTFDDLSGRDGPFGPSADPQWGRSPMDRFELHIQGPGYEPGTI